MARRPPPITPTLRARLVAAVEALWARGCPVARDAEGLVEVGARRWRSAARRRVPLGDPAARVRDLTAGLVAHFEPDPKLVGPLVVDYECVAEELARILGADPEGDRDGG